LALHIEREKTSNETYLMKKGKRPLTLASIQKQKEKDKKKKKKKAKITENLS